MAKPKSGARKAPKKTAARKTAATRTRKTAAAETADRPPFEARGGYRRKAAVEREDAAIPADERPLPDVGGQPAGGAAQRAWRINNGLPP